MIKRIEEIAINHGVFISYEIINQINNGESEAIKGGLIPQFTFTVYVTSSDGEEIEIQSHDELDVALLNGINIAESYIKHNMNFG